MKIDGGTGLKAHLAEKDWSRRTFILTGTIPVTPAAFWHSSIIRLGVEELPHMIIDFVASKPIGNKSFGSKLGS
jgi:hypothetical protein